MTADLMLVLAMLCIAWGLRHDLVDQFSTGTDRGGDLGYDTPVSRIGSLADYQVVAFSAEGGFEKEIARNG
jgi:hypothetical protein